MTNCNICGGGEFAFGPSGRLSATGLKPKCTKCFSLERHRSYRKVMEQLAAQGLFKGKALQFSEDVSANSAWFSKHEVSVYNGNNSLDLQNIDRPPNAYQVVICNHVLEHVPDDRRALQEMMRILEPNGILFLAVPDPVRRMKTTDWGYPKESDHGHYRLYGADIESLLASALPDVGIYSFRQPDPVTQMDDIVFLLTKSQDTGSKILATLRLASTIQLPERRKPMPSGANPLAPLEQYISTGFDSIEGWVDKGLWEILAFLHSQQRSINVAGGVCEIGVHHGRFLFGLQALKDPGLPALAIDVFDAQEFNIDQSGMGSKAKFIENAKKYSVRPASVSTIEGDSLMLRGADVANIREKYGRFSIFSVDGGHTADHVIHDFKVAMELTSPGGIILIDDYNNPWWPGVQEGIAKIFNNDAPTFVPIFCGMNKLIVTDIGHHQRYFEALNQYLASSPAARTKVNHRYGWKSITAQIPQRAPDFSRIRFNS
jgi:SAM-dependent methyltransferase